METCSNCGRALKAGERAYVFDGRVVCGRCDAVLRATTVALAPEQGRREQTTRDDARAVPEREREYYRDGADVPAASRVRVTDFRVEVGERYYPLGTVTGARVHVVPAGRAWEAGLLGAAALLGAFLLLEAWLNGRWRGSLIVLIAGALAGAAVVWLRNRPEYGLALDMTMKERVVLTGGGRARLERVVAAVAEALRNRG